MSVVHILVALLVAIIVIGLSLPAQAGCEKCQNCSTQGPAKKVPPCPETGVVCQIAPACASQLQKAPAQIGINDLYAGRVAFNPSSSITIKSAYLTPETAPPRA